MSPLRALAARGNKCGWQGRAGMTEHRPSPLLVSPQPTNHLVERVETPRTQLADDASIVNTPGSAISWALSDSSTERTTPQNTAHLSASVSNTPRRRLTPRIAQGEPLQRQGRCRCSCVSPSAPAPSARSQPLGGTPPTPLDPNADPTASSGPAASPRQAATAVNSPTVSKLQAEIEAPGSPLLAARLHGAGAPPSSDSLSKFVGGDVSFQEAKQEALASAKHAAPARRAAPVRPLRQRSGSKMASRLKASVDAADTIAVLEDAPPEPITDANPWLSPTHPSHPLQDVPDCSTLYAVSPHPLRSSGRAPHGGVSCTHCCSGVPCNPLLCLRFTWR